MSLANVAIDALSHINALNLPPQNLQAFISNRFIYKPQCVRGMFRAGTMALQGTGLVDESIDGTVWREIAIGGGTTAWVDDGFLSPNTVAPVPFADQPCSGSIPMRRINCSRFFFARCAAFCLGDILRVRAACFARSLGSVFLAPPAVGRSRI